MYDDVHLFYNVKFIFFLATSLYDRIHHFIAQQFLRVLPLLFFADDVCMTTDDVITIYIYVCVCV